VHTTETEIALIHQKLEDLDKLEERVATLTAAYHADRVEVQNLLRLINSLKRLLTVLATTIAGSIVTALFNEYK
jgi:DnaJ-domain-containing protein 1